MSFTKFDLNPKLTACIKAMGYVKPTPIQSKAIPPVLEGRDVLGLAQTGTGKTAAFALPILQQLLRGPRGRVRALVIAPTRELAAQIEESFRSLGRGTGLRTATVYGGVGFVPQQQKLRGKAEIVVACPGRLLDHLGRKTANLSHVEVLVIDEADRLFDMGFLPDIRKIMGHLPTRRQTLFFSATMPRDVEKLAHDVLGNPVRVQIGFCRPAETVSHALYPVKQQRKTALLKKLLTGLDTDSVLVFTRTKHRAKKLATDLEHAGFGATALQGNMSQSKRQAALDGFRKGTVRILVATDLAARGIDVLSISHVINYDIPDTADAYTHRIGRTGRASSTGEAFTFVVKDDGATLRLIERALGGPIEERHIDGFDYAAGAREDDQAQRSHRPFRKPGRAGQNPGSRARSTAGGRVKVAGWGHGPKRGPRSASGFAGRPPKARAKTKSPRAPRNA